MEPGQAAAYSKSPYFGFPSAGIAPCLDMEWLGLNFDKGSRITFNHPVTGPPLASVFVSVEGGTNVHFPELWQ